MAALSQVRAFKGVPLRLPAVREPRGVVGVAGSIQSLRPFLATESRGCVNLLRGRRRPHRTLTARPTGMIVWSPALGLR